MDWGLLLRGAERRRRRKFQQVWKMDRAVGVGWSSLLWVTHEAMSNTSSHMSLKLKRED